MGKKSRGLGEVSARWLAGRVGNRLLDLAVGLALARPWRHLLCRKTRFWPVRLARLRSPCLCEHSGPITPGTNGQKWPRRRQPQKMHAAGFCQHWPADQGGTIPVRPL